MCLVSGRFEGVHMLTAMSVGEAAPTEFRIFAAGKITTTRGDFLFDEAAAKSVMAAYAAHGAEVMLDLEHLSLDPESRAYDPDARGWCKLELRNGELWATDVRWTADGSARLSEKRQRYISPAFEADKKTGRIMSLLNIAITALPATDHLAPLVAARRNFGAKTIATTDTTTEKLTMLDPKLITQAIEAIKAGDGAQALALLESLVANAAGAGESEPAGEPMASGAMPPEEQPAAMAAASLLMRLSGKATVSESVLEAQTWQRSHLELTAERAKLSQERAVLEASERDGYGVEMVAKLSEEPWRVWDDPIAATDPAKRKLAEPLASMPIVQLRAHMTKLRAARGNKPTAPAPRPPAGNADTHGLSESELAVCARTGCDPATYAKLKTQQAPRS